MKLNCNFDNFIMTVDSNEISESLSEKIIDYHNNSSDKREGLCYADTEARVDKSTKDSIDTTLYTDSTLFGEFMEYLQKCADEYVKKYSESGNTSRWAVLDSINIQHYSPGGGFHRWHTERAGWNHPQVSRHLVFMMYLNDVTDNGETEFLYQNLKIIPEKGKLIIWPSDWTHTHRGITSSTQEKYIITGWFNFCEVQPHVSLHD
jgi:hypothetical protein